MIEIIQHKVTNNELISNINKLEEIEVTINKSMVEHDINRLKAELENSINRYDKANIKALIKHLEKIVQQLNEESKLEICWNISKDNIPTTYPIKFINEELYKIDTSNYVEVSNEEKIVNIDIKELADIIAFEFIYKELGETHDTIEELLDKCGILGFEESKILTNKFKENNDNMFELSRSMKVSETPYLSSEDHELQDYFNTRRFKADDYKEVVEYSCMYASTLIANSILNNLNLNKIGYKLLAINPTNIVLIIDKLANNEDYHTLIDDISVRAFGRRFIVKTNIGVF